MTFGKIDAVNLTIQTSKSTTKPNRKSTARSPCCVKTIISFRAWVHKQSGIIQGVFILSKRFLGFFEILSTLARWHNCIMWHWLVIFKILLWISIFLIFSFRHLQRLNIVVMLLAKGGVDAKRFFYRRDNIGFCRFFGSSSGDKFPQGRIFWRVRLRFLRHSFFLLKCLLILW